MYQRRFHAAPATLEIGSGQTGFSIGLQPPEAAVRNRGSPAATKRNSRASGSKVATSSLDRMRGITTPEGESADRKLMWWTERRPR